MTDADGAAAKRGRPRDAAVDRNVIDTVLRLIGDGAAIGDLSMEGIAREAGVGKATLYRRWPNKEALLLDAMVAVEQPEGLPALPGTSFRDDLITAVETIRRRGLAKRDSALMRTMLAQMQHNPELWQRYHDTVIATRRAALARLLERGIAEGQVRPELGDDMELLVDFVTGTLLARTTLRQNAPLNEGLSERVTDLILDGIRPPGA